MSSVVHRVKVTNQAGLLVEFDCRDDTSIASALSYTGYTSTVVCGNGGCGACVGNLVRGEVNYRQPVSMAKLNLSRTFDVPRPVFLCRASPATDVEIRITGDIKKRSATPMSDLLNKL